MRAAFLECHLDRALWGRIFLRVIEEDLDDLLQVLWRAVDRDAVGDVLGERQALFEEEGVKGEQLVRNEARQVDGLQRHLLDGTAVDTGELQERLAANAAEQQADNDQAAAEAAEQKAAEDEAAVDLSGVACIGDSVMPGSSGELRKVLPGCIIDAEVSRYVGGGLDAAKEMAAQRRLGKNVVIALGTNGPIAGYEKYEVQTRALLEYLGPDRHIFWVNVYCPELSWQQTNNDYLVSMAKDHPNVTIVDWYGLVSKHPEWLGGDGIHPNDEGTAAYAKLIHDTMAETLAHPAAG